MQGKVKWFKKSYGFIVGEDGNDYFAHYQNIISDGYRELVQDEEVTFEPAENERGRQAINIERGMQ